MNRKLWSKQLPLALLATALVGSALAWQVGPTKARPAHTDTIPDRHKKVRDIDEALEEVEKGRTELDRTLEKGEWQQELRRSLEELKLNSEQIKAQIQMALKEVDAVKIQADVQKSLKEIDAVKMKADMQKALSEVDAEKIKAEVQEALKAVDVEKIKAQAEEAVAAVDAKKLQAEMQRLKKVDMKKIEEDLRKMGPEIEKSLAGARESLEKAKQELTAYKSFIDGLAADGLIDRKGNYTIEWKNGTLSINGKAQSEEVFRKYKAFLSGHKDFTIKKDEDDFNIDND